MSVADLIVKVLTAKTIEQTLTLDSENRFSLLELKQVFRTIAKQIHPDKTNCPGAKEAFIKVHSAYESLCDRAVNGLLSSVTTPQTQQHHSPPNKSNFSQRDQHCQWNHRNRKKSNVDLDFDAGELNRDETEQKDWNSESEWFKYRSNCVRRRWNGGDQSNNMPRFEDLFDSDDDTDLQMNLNAGLWRVFAKENEQKKQKINDRGFTISTKKRKITADDAAPSNGRESSVHAAAGVDAGTERNCCCLLCKRMFKSEQHLLAHETQSKLHQSNLKLQNDKSKKCT